MLNYFQLFKTEQVLGCPITLSSTMFARKRRPDATETLSASTPNLVRPPEFDTCKFYAEAVNLFFDPKRVLLRRLFFMDEGRSKYVSVGNLHQSRLATLRGILVRKKEWVYHLHSG